MQDPEYELTGGWGVEPPTKFSTPRVFYIFSPRGTINPSPGPGFWPQVVFLAKSKNLHFYLNSKKFYDEGHICSPLPHSQWGGDTPQAQSSYIIV